MEQVLQHYPKTSNKPRAEILDDEGKCKAKLLRLLEHTVKRDASPGVPLLVLATTNEDVITSHSDLVVECAYQRLQLLAHSDLPETAVERVRGGFCDPVRIFVKNEPHNKQKIQEKRFRLISSISLVDQLVERYLFGIQNFIELRSWRSIPSAPGLGFADEDAQFLWDAHWADLQEGRLVEADVSGWDWTVQGWELEAEAEMRIRLCDASGAFAQAMRARIQCLSLSVFMLSDGVFYAQTQPGIMKSGSYLTSSGNSRIRVLVAALIGAAARAMGDDTLETFVENAKEKYAALGHKVKDYRVCDEEFEFCSQTFRDGKAFPAKPGKLVFRILHKEPEAEFSEQFAYEMRWSPLLEHYKRELTQYGWRWEN